MARSVNLKNQSIELLAHFAPEVRLTRPVPDTAKGLVALMAPPDDSVARRHEPAAPSWVVLPRYQAGQSARLSRADRSRVVLLMAEQSFNYDIHGVRGFEVLCDLVARCQCLQFEYSALEDAAEIFERLADA